MLFSKSFKKFFPNINKLDFIEINLKNVILSEVKNPIKIYNTFGECVMTLTLALSQREREYRIDVSQLPVGIYFIQIGN